MWVRLTNPVRSSAARGACNNIPNGHPYFTSEECAKFPQQAASSHVSWDFAINTYRPDIQQLPRLLPNAATNHEPGKDHVRHGISQYHPPQRSRKYKTAAFQRQPSLGSRFHSTHTYGRKKLLAATPLLMGTKGNVVSINLIEQLLNIYLVFFCLNRTELSHWRPMSWTR